MLEEVGLPYEVRPINLQKRDKLSPEYLAVNPNNKIPSIIDTDGPGGQPFKLFESGAILMYLAEKTGKFFPQDMRKRYEVIQWLMFQMGGVGPMFGQANYFLPSSGESPLRHRALSQRSAPALQSLGPTTRAERVSCRRVLHRRHRHIPLGLAPRHASGEIGGISERETLVRRDFGAAGGSARDGGAEGLAGCR